MRDHGRAIFAMHAAQINDGQMETIPIRSHTLRAFIRNASVLFCATSTSVTLAAQTMPVRPLGPVLATATEPLGSVSQVRVLHGGRLIVNDVTGRRVVMFDSTLSRVTVVADSTTATGTAYGSRLGGLIAYRGDSTLFVDPASLSMLVIDPIGKIARTMAVPRPRDVQNLIGGPFGTPAFDGLGRLVYRATPTVTLPKSGGAFVMPIQPESALIVRFDLSSRALDTVAVFRIPKVVFNVVRDADAVRVIPTVNPIPLTDDWAVLSNGTVAIVRGREYRVEFVASDGKQTSPPKLPFDWQRLSDDEKVAVIDSTHAEMEKARAAQLAQIAAAGSQPTLADSAPTARRQLAQAESTISPVGRGSPSDVPPLPQFVDPSELPDYRPAFRQGAARGDADGNLWIRTTKFVNGGPVYDVVNQAGALIDRIRIPPGRVIAGFGAGGVVYMGVVDGTVTRLERARVR